MKREKEVKEIIGLNEVWGCQNLATDFFWQHLWPLMQANVEFASAFDEQQAGVHEWDWLITTGANPYYAVLLNYLIKPKNILVLLDKREENPRTRGFFKELLKRKDVEFSVIPKPQPQTGISPEFLFSRFPDELYEKISKSGRVDVWENSHVTKSGETVPFEVKDRILHVAVDFTAVYYRIAKRILEALEEIRAGKGEKRRLGLSEFYIEGKILMENSEMNPFYGTPAVLSGVHNEKKLFPYALGWEQVSVISIKTHHENPPSTCS